jgi:hypothetical protein
MSDGQRTQIKIAGLVASVPDRDARPDLLQPGQQRAPEGAASSSS